ncbi:MAG: phosphatase PAP2 family protein, partial [Mycobacterium sp.]
GLTNQLAAFPSLHAGWALWVAIVVQMNARTSWVRGLGWAHALITAVVIVGTGNHWVVDAIAGTATDRGDRPAEAVVVESVTIS